MGESTSDRLKEGNYEDWSLRMGALLEEKDLWEVVEGTETEPADTKSNAKAIRAFRKKQRLARAKIILNVENSQLPHTRFPDPKQIWDELERIHRSRGFGTLLAKCQRFFSMAMTPNQTIASWVGQVRHAAFILGRADYDVPELDMILALTQGLPPSYAPFLVTLDTTPHEQLKFEDVITHLLNEETRQTCALAVKSEPEDEVISNEALAAWPAHRGAPTRRQGPLVCHRCGGIGHMRAVCPSRPLDSEAANVATAEEEDSYSF